MQYKNNELNLLNLLSALNVPTLLSCTYMYRGSIGFNKILKNLMNFYAKICVSTKIAIGSLLFLDQTGESERGF